MDFELFMNTMNRLRNWTVDQSKQKWTELDVPENYVDEGGYGAIKTRLRIPTALVGEDWSESEDETFESKSLVKKSKDIKDMSAEQQKTIKDELKHGFGPMSTSTKSSRAEDMQKPLESSAFTFEGEHSTLTISDFLQESMHGRPASVSSLPAKAKEAPGAGPGPAATAVKEAGGSNGADAPSPPSGKASETLVDIAAKRNAQIRSATREVKQLERKVGQTLASLATQVGSHHSYTSAQQELEYHTAVERLQAGLLWAGLKPSETKKDDKVVPSFTEMLPLTVGDCSSKDRLGTSKIIADSVRRIA
jgi:hypothetical protein